MTKPFLAKLLFRWLVSSLGLYVASAVLGANNLSIKGDSWAVLIAGLLLALVNMSLKPLLIFLSFPAIILSLGLFMLVVNGVLVLIVSWLYQPLQVSGLGAAILAGLVIGLVNFLVSRILEE